jgi:outer membrane lipoprotein carrier protein
MSGEERARRLDRARERLAASLADVRSLTADFTQRKHLQVFGGTVESRGSVALAPPDRFAWCTTSPLAAELIVNGDKALRRRTSRDGKVTEVPVDLERDPVTAATVRQVTMWTCGDLDSAAKSFDLALVSEQPLVVTAVPRDEMMRAVIASVRVTFATDPLALSEVVLHEKAGDETKITFSAVRRNEDIPDERFSVQPRTGR